MDRRQDGIDDWLDREAYLPSLIEVGRRLGFSTADIDGALTMWIDQDGNDVTPKRFRELRKWMERELQGYRADPTA